MSKIPFKKTFPIMLASTLAMTSPLFAQEVMSKSDIPTITIYQGGIALVAESRELELSNQQEQLFLPNVAPETLMESLMIALSPKDARNPTPRITEKKLNLNLLSPASLIQYSVGKSVKVITSYNGKEKTEEATILSNNGGLLLQYKDRVELDLPKDARLAFTEIPAGLNTTPVLSVILKDLPDANAQYRADLNYLTRGISWNADYIAKLNDETKTLQLEGWATLNNQSGMNYPDFNIQLVAGELNILTAHAPRVRTEMLMKSSAAMDMQAFSAGATAMGDYHLYKIPYRATLNQQEQTQFSLFNNAGIPFTKRYTFDNMSPTQRISVNQARQNANISIHFTNNDASQLGFPLPEGIVRLYQTPTDNSEGTAFLGEDRMRATPNKQPVVLNTGNAFDLTLQRKQTQFAMINEDEWEVSYTLTLNNAKDEVATTIVKEGFYPSSNTNWEITESSQKPLIQSDTAIWSLDIPAKGQAKISYSVRYTLFQEESKPAPVRGQK